MYGRFCGALQRLVLVLILVFGLGLCVFLLDVKLGARLCAFLGLGPIVVLDLFLLVSVDLVIVVVRDLLPDVGDGRL